MEVLPFNQIHPNRTINDKYVGRLIMNFKETASSISVSNSQKLRWEMPEIAVLGHVALDNYLHLQDFLKTLLSEERLTELESELKNLKYDDVGRRI